MHERHLLSIETFKQTKEWISDGKRRSNHQGCLIHLRFERCMYAGVLAHVSAIVVTVSASACGYWLWPEYRDKPKAVAVACDVGGPAQNWDHSALPFAC